MSTRIRLNLVLAAAVPLLAQSPPDFRVDVNLVRLPCIATQADGAPMQGLRRDEFIVKEDGVPQQVKYLWQEQDLPLTVVLIGDASCTERRFANDQRRDVIEFLDRVLSRNDRAVIVSATDQARLLTDLTDSVERLRSGATRLGIRGEGGILGDACSGRKPTFLSSPEFGFPCGLYTLWNAVFFSAKLGLRPQAGRKAMLLLTTGLDSGSDHDLEDAVAASQDANAMVYSIRFASSMPRTFTSDQMRNWVERGKFDLEQIARATGGLEFDAKKDEPTAVFARIEADLRNQYVLGYTPSTVNGKRGFRKIKVKVTRPGLTVRAQERYYVQ